MKKLSLTALAVFLMVFPGRISAQEFVTEPEAAAPAVSVAPVVEEEVAPVAKKEKVKKEKVVKEKKEKIKKEKKYGLFNHVGIGAGAAVFDGVSFTAGVPVGGHLQVRGTYSIGIPDALNSFIPTSITHDFGEVTFNDGSADKKVNLNNVTAKAAITPNVNAFVDLYPSKKGSFHFTVGLVGITAQNLATVSADLHDPLYSVFPEKEGAFNTIFVEMAENEDGSGESIRISPDQNGVVSVDLSTGKTLRPYFGIGWGRVASIKSRITLSLDLGVQKAGLALQAYHWDELHQKMVAQQFEGRFLPKDIKEQAMPVNVPAIGVSGTVGEFVDKLANGEVLKGFIPVARLGLNITLF